jgi:hypothetical protein
MNDLEQGPMWLAFLLWVGVPTPLFFMALTFTG